MRRRFVAAALVAALFIMPATVNADETGKPACSDSSCGGGTGLPPGCEGLQQDSSSGDLVSFATEADPEDAFEDALADGSITIPDVGTWDLNYVWQAEDSNGNIIDSGTAQETVTVLAGDGTNPQFSFEQPVGKPPRGGKISFSVFGGNQFGNSITGAGSTANYNCTPTF